jgi:hypothetical protein
MACVVGYERTSGISEARAIEAAFERAKVVVAGCGEERGEAVVAKRGAITGVVKIVND